jgi:ATP-binding cassette subfamily F protein uup
MPLLVLQDIHLSFTGAALLDGANLMVNARDRLCLVGRNGSGKSTLLKIAAGLTETDRGARFIEPRATVRYLPQEPDLSAYATTRAFVEAGLAPGDDPNRAYYLLGSLGLTGEEPTANLSGGEARRAALARTLAPQPDILLLDEPTNHLDLPAIEWLEQELASLRSALVLISHDRRFLQKLSRTTLWLDRGSIRQLDGGFSQFEAWRDDLLEREEQAQHKLDRKIVREEDWVRYGVSGRRKRNQRRLAELGQLRQVRRDHRAIAGAVKLLANETEGGSALVIKAEGLAKSFGAKPIVDDFSIRIYRGDRIGIVGPNGAGKTTLINLLTGRLAPDRGTLTLSPTLAPATLDQSRASLDPEASVRATLTGDRGDVVKVGTQTRHVMSYMKDFLFAPEQAGTPVRLLSGGERARLLLAKALATPSNLLVLDEPTNDLDLETLDLLQEMIADYAGTVLLVSHDRDFLDRVATSVLMAEGDGRFAEYAGGYSDMVAQRGAGVSAREKTTPSQAKTVAPPGQTKAPNTKRKLSFKDTHALEKLPAQIEALEADIARLSVLLADTTLYPRDPKFFQDLSAKLAAAQQQLSDAETSWLELQILRDDIEGKAQNDF